MDESQQLKRAFFNFADVARTELKRRTSSGVTPLRPDNVDAEIVVGLTQSLETGPEFRKLAAIVERTLYPIFAKTMLWDGKNTSFAQNAKQLVATFFRRSGAYLIWFLGQEMASEALYKQMRAAFTKSDHDVRFAVFLGWLNRGELREIQVGAAKLLGSGSVERAATQREWAADHLFFPDYVVDLHWLKNGEILLASSAVNPSSLALAHCLKNYSNGVQIEGNEVTAPAIPSARQAVNASLDALRLIDIRPWMADPEEAVDYWHRVDLDQCWISHDCLLLPPWAVPPASRKGHELGSFVVPAGRQQSSFERLVARAAQIAPWSEEAKRLQINGNS